MTIANWCIFIAFLIPYFFVFIAKVGAKGSNESPREFFLQKQGWRSRAYFAHLNGFEIFAPFAVAVILAQLNKPPQQVIDILAESFIAFRIIHGGLYLFNIHHYWRSLVWLGSFLCVIFLFLTIVPNLIDFSFLNIEF